MHKFCTPRGLDGGLRPEFIQHVRANTYTVVWFDDCERIIIIISSSPHHLYLYIIIISEKNIIIIL